MQLSLVESVSVAHVLCKYILTFIHFLFQNRYEVLMNKCESNINDKIYFNITCNYGKPSTVNQIITFNVNILPGIQINQVIVSLSTLSYNSPMLKI